MCLKSVNFTRTDSNPLAAISVPLHNKDVVKNQLVCFDWKSFCFGKISRWANDLKEFEGLSNLEKVRINQSDLQLK